MGGWGEGKVELEVEGGEGRGEGRNGREGERERRKGHLVGLIDCFGVGVGAGAGGHLVGLIDCFGVVVGAGGVLRCSAMHALWMGLRRGATAHMTWWAV